MYAQPDRQDNNELIIQFQLRRVVKMLDAYRIIARVQPN